MRSSRLTAAFIVSLTRKNHAKVEATSSLRLRKLLENTDAARLFKQTLPVFKQ